MSKGLWIQSKLNLKNYCLVSDPKQQYLKAAQLGELINLLKFLGQITHRYKHNLDNNKNPKIRQTLRMDLDPKF
jgi:hypothetical protein